MPVSDSCRIDFKLILQSCLLHQALQMDDTFGRGRLAVVNPWNLAVGGSETTYWTSYFWNTSKATSGFRLCLRGCYANNCGLCGSSALDVYSDVSSARGHIGAALCEAASEWSVEPEYYAAA